MVLRAVDARIVRAVPAWDTCDETDIVCCCLIECLLDKGCTVGDIDGWLIAVDPVAEFGIPSFVRGAPVENLSDDGSASLVDTEADFELLESAIVVRAVAVCNVERWVVFVMFVEAVDGEGGGISVKAVAREMFVRRDAGKHGRKHRGFSGVGEFIECSRTRVVVEVVRFDTVTDEFRTRPVYSALLKMRYGGTIIVSQQSS